MKDILNYYNNRDFTLIRMTKWYALNSISVTVYFLKENYGLKIKSKIREQILKKIESGVYPDGFYVIQIRIHIQFTILLERG